MKYGTVKFLSSFSNVKMSDSIFYRTLVAVDAKFWKPLSVSRLWLIERLYGSVFTYTLFDSPCSSVSQLRPQIRNGPIQTTRWLREYSYQLAILVHLDIINDICCWHLKLNSLENSGIALLVTVNQTDTCHVKGSDKTRESAITWLAEVLYISGRRVRRWGN